MTVKLRLGGRSVVLVGEGPGAQEQRALLERLGSRIVEEGSKAAFAIVVDDPGAVSRLKMRGALVYAVGQPDLCDFIPTTDIEPSEPVKAAKAVKLARVKPPRAQQIPKPAAEHVEVPQVKRQKPPRAERVETPKTERVPVVRPAIVRFIRRFSDIRSRVADEAATRAKPTTQRARARIVSPFRPLLVVGSILATAIENRISRARERPLSLDLALAKGGLLDSQVVDRETATKASQADAPQDLQETSSAPEDSK